MAYTVRYLYTVIYLFHLDSFWFLMNAQPCTNGQDIHINTLNLGLFFTKTYSIPTERLDYTTRVAWNHSVTLYVLKKKNINGREWDISLNFSVCGLKNKEAHTALEQHKGE